MDQSTRDAVRRLQRIVVKSSGDLLGVVATGTSSGSGYSGYATDVYASPNVAGGRILGTIRRKRSRRRAQRAQRRAVSPP